MIILDRKTSSKILITLFQKLKRKETMRVKKFLSQKPIEFLDIFVWVRNELSLLWKPEEEQDKTIDQIFAKIIILKKSNLNLLLSKLFIKSKTEDVYGAGDWLPEEGKGGRVSRFKSYELKSFIENRLFSEGYFFPLDLSWILIVYPKSYSLFTTNNYLAKFKDIQTEMSLDKLIEYV